MLKLREKTPHEFRDFLEEDNHTDEITVMKH